MIWLWISLAAFAGEKSAKDTIESFYKAYLPKLGAKPSAMPKMEFSASFRAVLKKNEKICRDHADGDVCGWAADGDPYIDAQDFDEHLTAQSAGLKVEESKPGEVRVELNVFPHAKKEYSRVSHLVYKMVREGKEWKMDDLITDGRSARQQIEEENQEFLQAK